jgi:putative hemolysin
MTHRTEITGIPCDAGFSEVLQLIQKEHYSRIPVYDESIDDIVGILHVKDLVRVFEDNPKEFKVQDIMREPYFVPASKRTNELFKELKLTKTHMAVVIDEYGGTAGIITLEDLIEEIVGNISDEYDDEEKEIEKLDESTYIIDGSAELEEVEEALGTELKIDRYETMSGFIIGQLGRIPKKDENPVIEYKNLVFKVMEVEEKRISRVKVCKS